MHRDAAGDRGGHAARSARDPLPARGALGVCAIPARASCTDSSRIPVLRHALAEAHRFEERRTIRFEVKLFALAMAWGSVLFTAIAAGLSSPVLLGFVIGRGARRLFRHVVVSHRDLTPG